MLENGQFERASANYDIDLKKYNNDVDYYNSHGGTQEEENSLNSRRNALEKRRKSINQALDLINKKVDVVNTSADNINLTIADRKDRQETQGEYYAVDKRIDIFTFNDKDHLKLVLMHEIGHAFGSEHALNTSSIMYYLLNQQNQTDPRPQTEDVELVNSVCRIK